MSVTHSPPGAGTNNNNTADLTFAGLPDSNSTFTPNDSTLPIIPNQMSFLELGNTQPASSLASYSEQQQSLSPFARPHTRIPFTQGHATNTATTSSTGTANTTLANGDAAKPILPADLNESLQSVINRTVSEYYAAADARANAAPAVVISDILGNGLQPPQTTTPAAQLPSPALLAESIAGIVASVLASTPSKPTPTTTSTTATAGNIAPIQAQSTSPQQPISPVADQSIQRLQQLFVEPPQQQQRLFQQFIEFQRLQQQQPWPSTHTQQQPQTAPPTQHQTWPAAHIYTPQQQPSRSPIFNKIEMPKISSKNIEESIEKLECWLNINGVFDDALRFETLRMQLDSATYTLVGHLFRQPPNTDKFNTLKRTVIKVFADSEVKKAQDLISGVQLGDKKPSMLLAELRKLYQGPINDGLFRELWLNRLPHNVKSILMGSATQQMSLEQLAETADRIMEYGASPPTYVSAISSSTGTSTSPPAAVEAITGQPPNSFLQELTKTLANIGEQLKQLTDNNHRSRQKRQQPQSSARQSPQSQEPSPKIWPGKPRKHQMLEFLPTTRRMGKSKSHSAKKRVTPQVCASTSAIPGQAPRKTTQTDNNRFFITDIISNTAFLVDTGAEVSVTPPDEPNHSKPTSRQLYTADGSPMPTFGERTRLVVFEPLHAYSWNFIVAPVTQPILGSDFLGHHNLLVDMGRKRLLPADHLPPLQQRDSAPSPHVDTVTISPDTPPVFITIMNKFDGITDFNAANKPTPPTIHHIVTSGPPVSAKARRLSPEKYIAAKLEFDTLVSMGICRPSSSQWASPLHMVKKADGSWRPTGDYRSLNHITIPDRYPLPYIEDVATVMHGKHIFSKVDLVRAYNQIAVSAEDIEKTAIVTPFGLFEFSFMSFGLRNAAQTMQRLVNFVVNKHPNAFAYLDDILIGSVSEDQHATDVENLLRDLHANGLTINAKKCVFARTEMPFLGHLIGAGFFSPLPEKTSAIGHIPLPVEARQLKSFLASINFYRHFMPHATEPQQKLTALIPGNKKNDRTKINWNDDAIAAFSLCKRQLADVASLTFPSPSAPLMLYTDASDTSVGAALHQFVDDQLQPIGFYSEKLSPAQRNYSTYDRELTAIFQGINHFRYMLEGREFTIFCDLILPNLILPHRDRPSDTMANRHTNHRHDGNHGRIRAHRALDFNVRNTDTRHHRPRPAIRKLPFFGIKPPPWYRPLALVTIPRTSQRDDRASTPDSQSRHRRHGSRELVGQITNHSTGSPLHHQTRYRRHSGRTGVRHYPSHPGRVPHRIKDPISYRFGEGAEKHDDRASTNTRNQPPQRKTIRQRKPVHLHPRFHPKRQGEAGADSSIRWPVYSCETIRQKF